MTSGRVNLKNGLTAHEVLLRKQQGLVNHTTERITKSVSEIIRDNVFTLFNGFNFAIALCLASVAAWINMAYLGVIFTNIIIGIISEIRAKRLVEKLSLISAVRTAVIRDGTTERILIEELVQDDLTILEAGNQICADSMVIDGEIEVNESLLTGEADPIIKKSGDLLLSGSFVISGKCYAKIEHVGEANFASVITRKAKQYKRTTSMLRSAIAKLTKFTCYFVAPIGLVLFFQTFYINKETFEQSVVSSAAASLGMLPKGLVLLITFALVVGVIRLAQKRILVQGLHSIETLSVTDMLCLDKTGTLTEGKMNVADISLIPNNLKLPLSIDELFRLYISASDDNNATFLALKEHFGVSDKSDSYEVISKIPFSSERKWGAVTFNELGTLLLGAPEKLNGGFSADALIPGNRLLYLAYKSTVLNGNVISDAVPIASVELYDPIRKDAPETLDFFKREGVAVKIISGDNPITVSYVAKRAGFNDYYNYIDLSTVSDDKIQEYAKSYSIFGRVTPEQKKRLIQIYKAEGHTVAMTGDGVNDVLALKEADCAIAMAAGSDAAKQVSQLVLLDSHFSSLPDVVMEGRRVINNLTRFGSIFIVKTIFTAILSVIGILTLTPYPFIPVQITVFNAFLEAYFASVMSFEFNTGRIYGSFLANIAKRAFPFGFTIAMNTLLIGLICPYFGLLEGETTTIAYITAGTVGVFALIRSCIPISRLRLFTLITAAAGFYIAAYILSDIIELVRPNGIMLLWVIAFAAFSVPVIMLTTKLTGRYT